MLACFRKAPPARAPADDGEAIRQAVHRAIPALSQQAERLGLKPVALELGPTETRAIYDAMIRLQHMTGDGFCTNYMGLRIKPRQEPGIALLALPRRRIGKFEVVCPTRFEAPQ